MTSEQIERLKLLREEIEALDVRITQGLRDVTWLQRAASEKRGEVHEIELRGAAPRRSLDAIRR